MSINLNRKGGQIKQKTQSRFAVKITNIVDKTASKKAKDAKAIKLETVDVQGKKQAYELKKDQSKTIMTPQWTLTNPNDFFVTVSIETAF